MSKKIEGAKKHYDENIDSILNEITPVEEEKIRNRLLFADKIEEMIEECDLSKSEFAKHLNKSPSEISKWVSGVQNFTIDTLTEITWACGKKINYLFRDKKTERTTMYKCEVKVVARVIEHRHQLNSFYEPYLFKLNMSSHSNKIVR